MRLTTHHLFLIAGAALFLYATACGLGITYDSRQYLAAAQSLLQSGTLRTADDSMYTHWPPLYPLWLAAWGGEVGSKYAHLLVWLATLWIAGRFGQKMLKTAVARVFFLSSLLGAPLLLVQVFAWSEGLFVLLTLLIFCIFQKYVKAHQVKYLVWMVVISNLLCLQRLTGVFFVLGFGLVLLIEQGENWQQAKRAFLYVAGSLVGLAAWMLRNTRAETEPSFVGDIFVVPFSESLINHASAVGNWFVPQTMPLGAKLFVVAVVVALLLECAWLLRPKPFFRQVAILAMVYLSGMTAVAGAPSEADRFVTPGYLWLMAAVAAAADAWLPVLRQPWHRWLIAAVLLGWLAYPTARTLKNVAFWHQLRCNEARETD